MKGTCEFCQKFGGATAGGSIADHVLFESENFVVIPTVGSIVPGWLLVVPRSHSLSIGSLPKARFHELVGIQETAADSLRDCFGPVSFFEHGAVRERQGVGCGVDHAHLHLVATNLDLASAAKALGPMSLQWRPAPGIQSATAYVAEQMPYVFVQPPSGGAWIGSAGEIQSQFIRRIIAAHAGQAGLWDWKDHPFEGNIRETVARVEAWKSERCGMPASFQHAC